MPKTRSLVKLKDCYEYAFCYLRKSQKGCVCVFMKIYLLKAQRKPEGKMAIFLLYSRF